MPGRRLYKTRLLLHSLRCQLPRCLSLCPPKARAQRWDSPASCASWASELLEPRSRGMRRGATRGSPGGSSLPGSPPLGNAAAGVYLTAAQKRCVLPTHVAGLGLPLTSRPGGKCDAIGWEVLIGHEGLPQTRGLSIYTHSSVLQRRKLVVRFC